MDTYSTGTCMHTNMHKYIHTYIHTYILSVGLYCHSTNIYIYKHICIHMHTCIQVYFGNWLHASRHDVGFIGVLEAVPAGNESSHKQAIPVCIYVCACMCVCVYIYISSHRRSAAHIPPTCTSYMHTYIHTNIYSRSATHYIEHPRHVFQHAILTYMHACMHAYAHLHTYIHTASQPLITSSMCVTHSSLEFLHAPTCIHAYIHTYIHTYSRSTMDHIEHPRHTFKPGIPVISA